MSQRAHEVTRIDAHSKTKFPTPPFFGVPLAQTCMGDLKGWFSTLETSFACIAEAVYVTLQFSANLIISWQVYVVLQFQEAVENIKKSLHILAIM